MRLKDISIIFVSPCESKYKYKCFEMKHYLDSNQIQWKLYKSELLYPQGLTRAFKNVLLQNMNDEPLLILEDDARIQDPYNFNYSLNDIPKDADAVYLGISAVGYGYFPMNSASVKPFKNNLYKVKSMYSSHAILYLSKRYKLAVAEAMNDQEVCDISMAKQQNKFNVYAYDKPIFIQKGTDINATLTQTTLTKIYFERKLTVVVCLILLWLLITKIWKHITST